MYTVRVTFGGLCAFVPSDEGNRPQWVGVFLVDADERSRQRFGIDLPPHYPFIRFKWSDLQGQDDPPVGDDRAIWSLQDKDVVIATGNNNPEGVSIRRGAINQVPEPRNDPFQESLFNWVSSLDDAQPGAGVLHAECFSPNPTERVSVRVHLTEGELMSSGIGQFDDDYVLSKFEPPIPLLVSGIAPAAPRPVRAFAREVVLEIREVQGPISIRARQFGTAEFHKLDFKVPPDGGSLEIEIMDLCLGDLIDDRGRETAVPRIYPRRDQDYLWYYILTEQFGGFPVDRGLPVPLPVQFRLRDPNDVGGGDPAQCTGTVTKPPTGQQVQGMRDLAAVLSA